jgi:hypothetical protein
MKFVCVLSVGTQPVLASNAVMTEAILYHATDQLRMCRLERPAPGIPTAFHTRAVVSSGSHAKTDCLITGLRTASRDVKSSIGQPAIHRWVVTRSVMHTIDVGDGGRGKINTCRTSRGFPVSQNRFVFMPGIWEWEFEPRSPLPFCLKLCALLLRGIDYGCLTMWYELVSFP